MDSELYIILKRGHVQRIRANRRNDGSPIIVWPVARTHEDAKRLAQWISKEYGIQGLRADRIGSVEGETLDRHINSALSDGCEAVCCVDHWNADGSPAWVWIYAEDKPKAGANSAGSDEP
jgi:hypothetical protein